MDLGVAQQPVSRGVFRRSPLSLAVPLEGSDTTPGLRSLERAQLKERLLSHSRADTSGLSSSSASRSAGAASGQRAASQSAAARLQYRGPFVRDITVDDLKQEPRPWSVFFANGERGRLWDAYSIPRSLAALQNRGEENLVFFLPNYLRVLFVGLLITFYVRPKALLAVGALALTLLANGAVSSARTGSWQAALAPAVSVLAASTLFLASYTRCISLLTRWLLYCCTLVGLHACARLAQSEHRARARGGGGGGENKRGGLGLPPLPFPFLGRWRQSERAAAAAQRDDRWQLFRELWGLGREAALDAYYSAWANAEYLWLTALDNVWTWFGARRMRAAW